MLTLLAKIRKDKGKKVKKLREKGFLPAVLYGPKTKNQLLEVNLKDFKKVYQEVGESSLVGLEISEPDKTPGSKKSPVLIHEIKKDYLTGNFTHIDFYQPVLTEEVEVNVPVIFEGVSPAVKDLGGTLVKEVKEIKVKALPQDLPHNIKVDISVLKTFEDEILIKNLELPQKVKIMKGLKEIVAVVVPPSKVEEDLAKPIEEKVEDVEKVEKEKKEREPEEAAPGSKEEKETKKPQK